MLCREPSWEEHVTLGQLALGLCSSGTTSTTLWGQGRPPRHQRPQGVAPSWASGVGGVLLAAQEGDQGAHPLLGPERVCAVLSHSTRLLRPHM